MQNSYESFIESCLYAGAAVEAPQSSQAQVLRSPAAPSRPVQDLLDSLQQAQSAFSKSLERYIEL